MIEPAAREAKWGRTLAKGRGLGPTATYSFLIYAAAVVEIVVSEDGSMQIPRIDIAVDCGPQVNPDCVRSQAEGSAIMGVSLAMMERSLSKLAESINPTSTITR